MNISKLKTEIQRPEQTGRKLCNHENETPLLSTASNHPGPIRNSSDSRTLHARKGAL